MYGFASVGLAKLTNMHSVFEISCRAEFGDGPVSLEVGNTAIVGFSEMLP